MKRPGFSAAWKAFLEIKRPIDEVGLLLGGKVGANIQAKFFVNACPIRMSYVLNKTGSPVRRSAKYASVSGKDGAVYLYRVHDMLAYLREQFGPPERQVHSPRATQFVGLKGILVVKGNGWSGARGHITLWNGAMCSDACHFTGDPDNGPFVPDMACLWELR